ncbi:unnamed protein product [Phyllotreta striolata]|uniref:Cell cycle checkpoint control protein n=1 Tax=Phyllotreta striolata TaxID=444603 RepID=A0A9P0GL28_PHYSR|nr:unnamed protein product [Phyllotreta striolata]
MNCIIPGQNLKVFAKALYTLGKIGDNLFVEVSKKQLKLITMNSRKTVCSQCNLLDTFFSNYEINENDLDSTGTMSCKIQMKFLLPLFKGTHLEKKFDYVKIEFTKHSDYIVFRMKYKCDEILMTHNLRLMDTETLTIGISPDTGCNTIGTTSAFCNQLLGMFSNLDNEILFEISTNKAVVRNYFVGEPVKSKTVRSQVNLSGTEFTMYSINEETVINFSLKPFRTAVNFAESFTLNLTLNFERGDKPLSIIIKNPTFELYFFIATSNPQSDNQKANSTNSIPTKVTQTNNTDISEEDRQVLLNENWEEGFNSESFDRIPHKITNSNSTSKNNQFVDIVEEALPRKRSLLDDENANVMEQDGESEEFNGFSLSQNSKTKRVKLVLGRCFEDSFSSQTLGNVLAPNSDSE